MVVGEGLSPLSGPICEIVIQFVGEFQKPMAVATMSTLLIMYAGIDPLTSRFTR